MILSSRTLQAIVVALTLCLGSCGAPTTPLARSASAGLFPLTHTSVLEHLTVPSEEEGQRRDYADAIIDAHAILESFAAQHGWSTAAAVPTFDSIEVFSSTEALWARVLEIYEAPSDTEMAGLGPVAALEGRVLMTVTPEEYARAHPAYAEPVDSLARLLAHEMVHRLHGQVLGGNEDAMGPRWFFEGFAVLGAGQDFDLGYVSYASADEALRGAASEAHPEFAYRRYAAALRFFAAQTPLADLVADAGSEGFEEGLRLGDDGDAAE